MKKCDQIKKLVHFFLILILVLVFLISGLQILESTVFSSGQNQEEMFERKTITRDGVEYFPRQDITVMLVMGIDQEGPVQDSGHYRNPGAADMVMLLIFDEKEENGRILYLNRDTMLRMPVLGLGGKEAGTTYAQLALAHTYGSGLEDSCENTKNAVSVLLNGIAIDYYIAVNMDAISILNDAVGGVKVTVTDDFSQVDPSITKGEVHLQSTDALGSIPAGEIAIPQGSHIYKDVIFLPDGVPSRGVLRLHASNVVSGRKLINLDLSSMGLEPEGVATRRGYLYISFHTPRQNRDNIIYRAKITRRN